MKTAVSLPDSIFREAERFARRTKKSRSRLFAEAIAEYLLRHSPDAITDAVNGLCDRLGDGQDTSFGQQAARAVLATESW